MSNHDPYSDSPSLLVGFSTTNVYSAAGADIVMESITLIKPQNLDVARTLLLDIRVRTAHSYRWQMVP